VVGDPLAMLGLAGGSASACWVWARRAGLFELLRWIVHARTEVALERERRTTLIETLERLPPGGTVIERGVDGRERVVQVPPPMITGRAIELWESDR
jgi:hypothetical protein